MQKVWKQGKHLIKRHLRKKTQFPKLHFGPGLFDLERSKVKGQFFLRTLPTMTSDMQKKKFFFAFLSAGLF